MLEQLWFLENFQTLAYFALSISAVWAFIYGIRFGVSYLKENDLWNKAQQVVRAIEQQAKFVDVTPERKKEVAMIALRKAAALLKLSVTDQQLDWLIEAAVQLMNAELGGLLEEVLDEE